MGPFEIETVVGHLNEGRAEPATDHDSLIAREAAGVYISEPVGVPATMKQLSPAQARLALQMLQSADQFQENAAKFREAALTRGTSAARVNLYLSAKSAGRELTSDELDRMSMGVSPS